MNRSYAKVALAAAGAVVCSLAFTGVASAGHGGNLHCGDVITADTTLTADVGPCATSAPRKGALTVRASGTSTDKLTLDLNGYDVYGCDTAPLTLTGLCNQPGVTPNDPSLVGSFVTGEGAGIVIDEQNDVQITDSGTGGTVRDFDTGIVIRGGDRNVIEKLDVLRNVGTAVTDSDYGEGIGIYTGATGSTHNTVKTNHVEGNGPYAGIALYNFDDTTGAQAIACATTTNTIGGPAAGDKNTVKDNYVVPNGTTFQDDGIRVEPDVCDTTVQNNTVTGSSLDGIAVFAKAINTKVLNNTVQGNGSHPLLTHRKGDGIVVFQTANNCTVSGNTAGGSNTGSTVSGSPPPATVQGNAGNGIRVDAHTCEVNGSTSTGNGYNAVVDGARVSDPRGDAAKASNTESQYAYYDLKDGQTDKACGSSATSPTGGTRNYWGNLLANAYGTRNRVPGTVATPAGPDGVPPAIIVPSHCID